MLEVGLRMMTESVVATDTQGVITEMNPSAERLTGWSRREALGQPHDRVLRLIGPTGAPEPSPLWACLREQVTIARGQQDRNLLSRDGRRLTVRLTPLRGRALHSLTGPFRKDHPQGCPNWSRWNEPDRRPGITGAGSRVRRKRGDRLGLQFFSTDP